MKRPCEGSPLGRGNGRHVSGHEFTRAVSRYEMSAALAAEGICPRSPAPYLFWCSDFGHYRAGRDRATFGP
jgi:hypothetical protein